MLEHLADAALEARSTQAVEMALMHQIFCGGELHIDAPCLSDNANPAADLIWLCRGIETSHVRSPTSGDHQRCEDSEQRCLAATVWAQEAKSFCRPDIQRHAV